MLSSTYFCDEHHYLASGSYDRNSPRTSNLEKRVINEGSENIYFTNNHSSFHNTGSYNKPLASNTSRDGIYNTYSPQVSSTISGISPSKLNRSASSYSLGVNFFHDEASRNQIYIPQFTSARISALSYNDRFDTSNVYHDIYTNLKKSSDCCSNYDIYKGTPSKTSDELKTRSSWKSNIDSMGINFNEYYSSFTRTNDKPKLYETENNDICRTSFIPYETNYKTESTSSNRSIASRHSCLELEEKTKILSGNDYEMSNLRNLELHADKIGFPNDFDPGKSYIDLKFRGYHRNLNKNRNKINDYDIHDKIGHFGYSSDSNIFWPLDDSKDMFSRVDLQKFMNTERNCKESITPQNSYSKYNALDINELYNSSFSPVRTSQSQPKRNSLIYGNKLSNSRSLLYNQVSDYYEESERASHACSISGQKGKQIDPTLDQLRSLLDTNVLNSFTSTDNLNLSSEESIFKHMKTNLTKNVSYSQKLKDEVSSSYVLGKNISLELPLEYCTISSEIQNVVLSPKVKRSNRILGEKMLEKYEIHSSDLEDEGTQKGIPYSKYIFNGDAYYSEIGSNICLSKALNNKKYPNQESMMESYEITPRKTTAISMQQDIITSLLKSAASGKECDIDFMNSDILDTNRDDISEKSAIIKHFNMEYSDTEIGESIHSNSVICTLDSKLLPIKKSDLTPSLLDSSNTLNISYKAKNEKIYDSIFTEPLKACSHYSDILASQVNTGMQRRSILGNNEESSSQQYRTSFDQHESRIQDNSSIIDKHHFHLYKENQFYLRTLSQSLNQNTNVQQPSTVCQEQVLKIDVNSSFPVFENKAMDSNNENNCIEFDAKPKDIEEKNSINVLEEMLLSSSEKNGFTIVEENVLDDSEKTSFPLIEEKALDDNEKTSFPLIEEKVLENLIYDQEIFMGENNGKIDCSKCPYTVSVNNPFIHNRRSISLSQELKSSSNTLINNDMKIESYNYRLENGKNQMSSKSFHCFNRPNSVSPYFSNGDTGDTYKSYSTFRIVQPKKNKCNKLVKHVKFLEDQDHIIQNNNYEALAKINLNENNQFPIYKSSQKSFNDSKTNYSVTILEDGANSFLSNEEANGFSDEKTYLKLNSVPSDYNTLNTPDISRFSNTINTENTSKINLEQNTKFPKIKSYRSKSSPCERKLYDCSYNANKIGRFLSLGYTDRYISQSPISSSPRNIYLLDSKKPNILPYHYLCLVGNEDQISPNNIIFPISYNDVDKDDRMLNSSKSISPLVNSIVRNSKNKFKKQSELFLNNELKTTERNNILFSDTRNSIESLKSIKQFIVELPTNIANSSNSNSKSEDSIMIFNKNVTEENNYLDITHSTQNRNNDDVSRISLLFTETRKSIDTNHPMLTISDISLADKKLNNKDDFLKTYLGGDTSFSLDVVENSTILEESPKNTTYNDVSRDININLNSSNIDIRFNQDSGTVVTASNSPTYAYFQDIPQTQDYRKTCYFSADESKFHFDGDQCYNDLALTVNSSLLSSYISPDDIYYPRNSLSPYKNKNLDKYFDEDNKSNSYSDHIDHIFSSSLFTDLDSNKEKCNKIISKLISTNDQKNSTSSPSCLSYDVHSVTTKNKNNLNTKELSPTNTEYSSSKLSDLYKLQKVATLEDIGSLCSLTKDIEQQSEDNELQIFSKKLNDVDIKQKITPRLTDFNPVNDKINDIIISTIKESNTEMSDITLNHDDEYISNKINNSNTVKILSPENESILENESIITEMSINLDKSRNTSIYINKEDQNLCNNFSIQDFQKAELQDSINDDALNKINNIHENLNTNQQEYKDFDTLNINFNSNLDTRLNTFSDSKDNLIKKQSIENDFSNNINKSINTISILMIDKSMDLNLMSEASEFNPNTISNESPTNIFLQKTEVENIFIEEKYSKQSIQRPSRSNCNKVNNEITKIDTPLKDLSEYNLKIGHNSTLNVVSTDKEEKNEANLINNTDNYNNLNILSDCNIQSKSNFLTSVYGENNDKENIFLTNNCKPNSFIYNQDMNQDNSECNENNLLYSSQDYIENSERTNISMKKILNDINQVIYSTSKNLALEEKSKNVEYSFDSVILEKFDNLHIKKNNHDNLENILLDYKNIDDSQNDYHANSIGNNYSQSNYNSSQADEIKNSEIPQNFYICDTELSKERYIDNQYDNPIVNEVLTQSNSFLSTNIPDQLSSRTIELNNTKPKYISNHKKNENTKILNEYVTVSMDFLNDDPINLYKTSKDNDKTSNSVFCSDGIVLNNDIPKEDKIIYSHEENSKKVINEEQTNLKYKENLSNFTFDSICRITDNSSLVKKDKNDSEINFKLDNLSNSTIETTSIYQANEILDPINKSNLTTFEKDQIQDIYDSSTRLSESEESKSVLLLPEKCKAVNTIVKELDLEKTCIINLHKIQRIQLSSGITDVLMEQFMADLDPKEQEESPENQKTCILPTTQRRSILRYSVSNCREELYSPSHYELENHLELNNQAEDNSLTSNLYASNPNTPSVLKYFNALILQNSNNNDYISSKNRQEGKFCNQFMSPKNDIRISDRTVSDQNHKDESSQESFSIPTSSDVGSYFIDSNISLPMQKINPDIKNYHDINSSEIITSNNIDNEFKNFVDNKVNNYIPSADFRLYSSENKANKQSFIYSSSPIYNNNNGIQSIPQTKKNMNDKNYSDNVDKKDIHPKPIYSYNYQDISPNLENSENKDNIKSQVSSAYEHIEYLQEIETNNNKCYSDNVSAILGDSNISDTSFSITSKKGKISKVQSLVALFNKPIKNTDINLNNLVTEEESLCYYGSKNELSRVDQQPSNVSFSKNRNIIKKTNSAEHDLFSYSNSIRQPEESYIDDHKQTSKSVSQRSIKEPIFSKDFAFTVSSRKYPSHHSLISSNNTKEISSPKIKNEFNEIDISDHKEYKKTGNMTNLNLKSYSDISNKSRGDLNKQSFTDKQKENLIEHKVPRFTHEIVASHVSNFEMKHNYCDNILRDQINCSDLKQNNQNMANSFLISDKHDEKITDNMNSPRNLKSGFTIKNHINQASQTNGMKKSLWKSPVGFEPLTPYNQKLGFHSNEVIPEVEKISNSSKFISRTNFTNQWNKNILCSFINQPKGSYVLPNHHINSTKTISSKDQYPIRLITGQRWNKTLDAIYYPGVINRDASSLPNRSYWSVHTLNNGLTNTRKRIQTSIIPTCKYRPVEISYIDNHNFKY